MKPNITIQDIESDALTANLLETAEEVVLDPELQLLLDIVSREKNISKEEAKRLLTPHRNGD